MDNVIRGKIKLIVEKFEIASGVEVAQLKDIDTMRTVEEVIQAFKYDMNLCRMQVGNAITCAEHELKKALAQMNPEKENNQFTKGAQSK